MKVMNLRKKTPNLVIAVCGVFLALGMTAAVADAQGGVLTGTVTDAASGAPIEGAKIVIMGAHGAGHTLTSVDGTYDIDGLRPGDVFVLCGARGYFPTGEMAAIAEDQVTVLDFSLEPLAFGTVTGVVTDAVTGEVIAGAVVKLRPVGKGDGLGGHGQWLTAVTGDDGSYSITNVFAGDYAATAWAFGYLRPEPVEVTVGDGETVTVDLVLEPVAFGGVQGVVTDSMTGDPVSGAVVSIGKPTDREKAAAGPGFGGHHTTTDENGFFLFAEVIVGDHQVQVFASGYERATASVEVIQGETTVIDFGLVLHAFGNLEGTVVDAATGDPIAAAKVFIVRGSAPGMVLKAAAPPSVGRLFAHTDDNGHFYFDEVLTGPYTVLVFAFGYHHGEVEAVVDEGQTTSVTIELLSRRGHR